MRSIDRAWTTVIDFMLVVNVLNAMRFAYEHTWGWSIVYATLAVALFLQDVYKYNKPIYGTRMKERV